MQHPGVKIHESAIVEPGAEIGEGTVVMAHAIVTAHATIGRNCRIHHGALVGGEPQDLSFDGSPSRVTIGDGTVVREYATVHRATKPGAATVVGPDCYLMANSHVAHDCVLGERVIVCNGGLVAGHVRIDDRAFISGHVVRSEEHTSD